jgi:hypothetical protein
MNFDLQSIRKDVKNIKKELQDLRFLLLKNQMLLDVVVYYWECETGTPREEVIEILKKSVKKDSTEKVNSEVEKLDKPKKI